MPYIRTKKEIVILVNYLIFFLFYCFQFEELSPLSYIF